MHTTMACCWWAWEGQRLWGKQGKLYRQESTVGSSSSIGILAWSSTVSLMRAAVL